MRRTEGYSLVEVVIGLGLMLLILGPLLALWIGASRAEKSLQARLELFQATSRVMSQVSRDVLASGGLATLTVPGTDESRQALMARGGRAIHYGISRENGHLMRHVHDVAGAQDIEAKEVGSFPGEVTFTAVEGGAIRVRVSLDGHMALSTALCPRGW